MPFVIWAHVLYGFVLDKNLEAAKFIEVHMKTLTADYKQMNFDLKPLCDIDLLKKYPEFMYFIAYMIDCGGKYTTLSTQKGDTFINAAVRMTFLTGKLYF